jgi:hypothetical protein
MLARASRRLLRFLVPASFALIGARMLLLASLTPASPVAPGADLPAVERTGELRQHGESWVRRRGGILQVHLQGDPATMGASHALLLRPEMLHNEGALWDVFETFVPTRPLRTAIVDISRVRFWGLDTSIGYARRVEIGAASNAFRPDPFDDHLPTYARFLMLNALYDVSLSFEHSPLIGCSSVYLSSEGLLGRNFDFEAHEVFDRDKAVVVFAETGKLPVLSVAWPGLSGVVTGMNSAGVAAVVHGARAGAPSASGEPVLITVREALANSRSAREAAAWIAAREAMVSHLVLVADAQGVSIVVERVPERPAHPRLGSDRLALTNHFEGPSAQDPANLRVREQTSTLARRDRLDVLLGDRAKVFDEAGVLRILRDRRAADGSELPLGDRRAIDADIATHGVVMNLRQRVVWVSRGPHLSGGFVRFDLRRWAADPAAERTDPTSELLSSD